MVEEMRKNISRALGIHAAKVSIKATTLEGLGALGRGEGIAAMAVAGVENRFKVHRSEFWVEKP